MQNYNFGFTKKGVSQSDLTGNTPLFFDALKNVYLGFANGRNIVIPDLLQAMNPDEILALAAGWAHSCRNYDTSIITKPGKLYSAVVRVGYSRHSPVLQQIKTAAIDNKVAPFAFKPGDLEARMTEVISHRPHVESVLSDSSKLSETIRYGLDEGHFNSDARTKGPSNRRLYAKHIAKMIENAYNNLQNKSPVDFYLGELRIALARDDGRSARALIDEQLPELLAGASDSQKREFELLRDRHFQPSKPVQRSLFD